MAQTKTHIRKTSNKHSDWDGSLPRRCDYCGATESEQIDKPQCFNVPARKSKINKRILSVTIKRMLDDSPDTSYLGEYGNEAESEYSIDRAHFEDCNSVTGNGPKLDRIAACLEKLAQKEKNCFGDSPEFKSLQEAYDELQQIADNFDDCDCGERGDMKRGQYRYFNPNWKNYKGLEEAEIRKYCLQDYERMESLNRGDFCFIGIMAEAKIGIPQGLPQTKTGQSYLLQTLTSGGLYGIESDSDKEYVASEEKNQLDELKDVLMGMGFSQRAISTAFKNVEHKDAF